MRTDLTQEQIGFYQANGYIVIEGFLAPEALESWRRNVDATWRRGQHDARNAPGDDLRLYARWLNL